MDKMVCPIRMPEIHIMANSLDHRLVGAFRGSIGLGVKGCRHAQADFDPLVELLPEITREQLVPIRGDCLWKPKLAVPRGIDKRRDVLSGSGRVSGFQLDIVCLS